MKALHRADLFCWSRFDEAREVDFNSVVWTRPAGNVVFDPLPLSAHDLEHLQKLGGVSWIVITNADHIREAAALMSWFNCQVAAPEAEKKLIDLPVDRWLKGGEALVPGLVSVAFSGGKTPGELAFVLEETTLITGDLIRSHKANSLMLLPDGKLQNPAAARESARQLLAFPKLTAAIVGDGWPFFGDVPKELHRLLG